MLDRTAILPDTWPVCVCICMAESLHCLPETMTTWLVSYIPIQNKSSIYRYIFIEIIYIEIIYIYIYIIYVYIYVGLVSASTCKMVRVFHQIFNKIMLIRTVRKNLISSLSILLSVDI